MLSLSRNRIEVVSPYAFDDLTSLIWLFLNSNKIKDFRDPYFEGTQSLRFLDLSDNMFSSLDLSSLTSLTYLNLSENLYTIIEGNWFSNNQELVKLDLSRCPTAAFDRLEELNQLCLQELNLEDNNLKDFSWDYDVSKGCIVVKNLTTADALTTHWEMTTTQTDAESFNNTELANTTGSDSYSERPPMRDPENISTASLILIVSIIVLISGLTAFLLVIIVLKLRRQRASTPNNLRS